VYNKTKILTATSGLLREIGWRQPTLAGQPTIDSDNLTANSSAYFEDAHGLVSIPNLYACQDDPDITAAEFNTLLDNLQSTSIVEFLDKVFSKSDLKENRILFPYENVVDNTLTNGGDTVGFEFCPSKRKDIAIRVNQIIATFNGAQEVRVNLFHSSQNASIASKSITTVANSDVSADLTTWIFENTTYKGGKYYICYVTSGLTYSAINREWDMASIQSRYNYVGIQPFKVLGYTSSTLWDLDNMEYTSDTYGLNFDISSHEDYTDLILRNKGNFIKGIQLQNAVKVLEIISTSTQTNEKERMAKLAYFALNGDFENNVAGLYTKLNREVEKLQGIFYEKTKIKSTTIR